MKEAIGLGEKAVSVAWQYEPEWDGLSVCLAFKAGKAVDIRAKSGKPLAAFSPPPMGQGVIQLPSPGLRCHASV